MGKLLREFAKGRWRLTRGPSLASVHTFSAESLPYGRELVAAEEEAKRDHSGVSTLP